MAYSNHFPSGGNSRDRLHYIDNARAFLMSFGVLLHTGDAIPFWLDSEISYASSLFRMNLFMLISGYFAALSLTKRETEEFIKSRVIVLGVPALVALAVLNPLTNYFINGSISGPAAMLQVAGVVSPHAQAGPDGSNWLLHIWFLLTLLGFCISIGAFVWLARHPLLDAAINTLLLKVKTQLLRFLILAVAMAVMCLAVRVFHRLTFELIKQDDIVNFQIQTYTRYAPFFLLGLLVFRHGALMEIVLRPIWLISALGLAALAAYEFAMPYLLQHIGHLPAEAGQILIQGFASFVICSAILSVFLNLANRTTPLLRFMADASYTVFLLHFLMIGLFGLGIKMLGLPTGLSYFATMVAAYAACLGVHKVIVQRSPLAAFLFNGKLTRTRQLSARTA